MKNRTNITCADAEAQDLIHRKDEKGKKIITLQRLHIGRRVKIRKEEGGIRV